MEQQFINRHSNKVSQVLVRSFTPLCGFNTNWPRERHKNKNVQQHIYSVTVCVVLRTRADQRGHGVSEGGGGLEGGGWPKRTLAEGKLLHRWLSVDGCLTAGEKRWELTAGTDVLFYAFKNVCLCL